MNIEFSPELARMLANEGNGKVLSSWILNNTKTGQHLYGMLQDWGVNAEEMATVDREQMFKDLTVIGSILPVLLKLRLLP